MSRAATAVASLTASRQPSPDQLIRELVGGNVRRAREQAGWNQRELAERLDAEPPQVSLWENGRKQPNAQSLMKIASVTGHAYGWFFDEHAEPEPVAPAP